MKRLFLSLLVVLFALNSYGQRHQVSVLAGYKFSEGVAVSVNYYYLISFMQIGPSVEVGTAKSLVDGSSKFYTAPGLNASLLLPFGKIGFIYPGITAHYRLADNYTGFEYGFLLGAVFEINQRLGLNIETGYRIYSVEEGDITLLNGTIPNSASGSNVPVQAGLRVRL